VAPRTQPTALKLVKGERKDRVNKSEPTPASLEVVPPARVVANAAAMAEWQRLAPDLVEKGVLAFWHVELFADYCVAVALVAEAEEHLAVEGYVVEAPVFDRNGKPTGVRMVRSEWDRVRQDALSVKERRGSKFGLTPSDAASIKWPDRGGADGGKTPARLMS
jgi:phage terminase small subunit